MLQRATISCKTVDMRSPPLCLSADNRVPIVRARARCCLRNKVAEVTSPAFTGKLVCHLALVVSRIVKVRSFYREVLSI